MNKIQAHVAIIGAGPSGLLLGQLLARQGNSNNSENRCRVIAEQFIGLPYEE